MSKARHAYLNAYKRSRLNKIDNDLVVIRDQKKSSARDMKAKCNTARHVPCGIIFALLIKSPLFLETVLKVAPNHTILITPSQ